MQASPLRSPRGAYESAARRLTLTLQACGSVGTGVLLPRALELATPRFLLPPSGSVRMGRARQHSLLHRAPRKTVLRVTDARQPRPFDTLMPSAGLASLLFTVSQILMSYILEYMHHFLIDCFSQD